ncbi:hypothetical protein TBS_18440 [Thermobispora bispora]|uniref:DUF3800 domain-containing protein n=1 Tax=Thermobispora bispora TaxID=2006 RepID=UPI0030E89347
MLFAYVDESGDPSGNPSLRGSPSYTLGVVLVRDTEWADAFDAVINLRRTLKKNFGLPVRAEVKASYLLRNEGAFSSLKLSSKQRRYIYQCHLSLLATAPARAFAVFVDKRKLVRLGRLGETRDLAWETLFQRLALTYERDNPGRKSPILIVHDEGEDATIRKIARKARRYLTAGSAYGPGSLRLPDRWLLDDPVSRKSHHSLFVQLADLVAYAATKRMIPGGARRSRVCPPSMWNHLGVACHAAANAQALAYNPKAVPGIVVRSQ